MPLEGHGQWIVIAGAAMSRKSLECKPHQNVFVPPAVRRCPGWPIRRVPPRNAPLAGQACNRVPEAGLMGRFVAKRREILIFPPFSNDRREMTMLFENLLAKNYV